MSPADALIAFLERLGLTQAELARQLPAPLRTVEDWLKRRRNPPKYLPRALRDLEREIANGSEIGSRKSG